MPFFKTVTTIAFDGQFWVALVERFDGDAMQLARHVFGAEPGNAELLDWAGRGFAGLDFQPATGRAVAEPPANPKRRKRAAAAEAKAAGASSRSRDALKLMAEMRAGERQSDRSGKRRAEAARRYADRVARKKARKRGKG